MNLRATLSDLRGASQLACDATIGITGVVEALHGTILRAPLPLGPMRKKPDAGLAKLVYGSIKGTTRVIDQVIGTVSAPLIGQPVDHAGSLERDAIVAALNGVFGDHLDRTNNPLATRMTLRLPPPGALRREAHGKRWLILVHGMCMSDRQWHRNGHDHGEALASGMGLTPVYVRYNTGLSLSQNGALLSQTLQAFADRHCDPADEIAMVGYSLGGLVARSAVTAAEAQGHQWPGQLDRLVFLGTPHAGAPLAVGGHGIDRALGFSPYSAAFARLATARSEGLQDLRKGLGPDLGDVPTHVKTFALAGALTDQPGRLKDGLLGDGLVPVHSALAERPGAVGHGAIPQRNQWVGRGIGHLDLLSAPEVHTQLVHFLSQ